MRKPLDLQAEIADAQDALARGEISRREFNKILFFISVASGLSMFQVEQANAWVATRMRKRSTGAGAAIIGSSLRFDYSRACYLSKTPASAGNRTKWSFSCWVKRGSVNNGNAQYSLFSAFAGGAASKIAFDLGGAGAPYSLTYDDYNAPAQFKSTAIFRDPSAWIHILVVVDTNSTVSAERVRAYVNGTRLTNVGASFSQGASTSINSTSYHTVGAAANSGVAFAGYYFDGGVSEVYFIDGQALSPSDFAQIDPTTGQSNPRQYAGAFGTNGFYLPFKNNSAVNGSGTASGSYPNVAGVVGLGADFSGNNNHWAGSGFTVNDQMLDTPSNNFCVLNSVNLGAGASITNGGLGFNGTTGNEMMAPGTFSVSSGKWYWEVTCVSGGGYSVNGIAAENANLNTYPGNGTLAWGYSGFSGNKYGSGSGSAYGSSYTDGDVIGVALDMDNGKIWFSKNGTWQASGDPGAGTNAAFTGLAGVVSPAAGDGATGAAVSSTVNFGQGGVAGVTFSSAAGGSFKYAAPTGFKALSTANLSAPAVAKPAQYMNVLAYMGNGGAQRVGPVIPVTPAYQVSRSVKINAADVSGFTRTWTGNATTWTFSAWIKRTSATYQCLFGYVNAPSTNYQHAAMINADGTIYFYQYDGSTYTMTKTTTFAMGDLSKWYHVVITWDTANGTAADRAQIFIDGVRQTSFSASINPGASQASYIGGGFAIGLGCQNRPGGIVYSVDGLLAEINFIDGQALTPSSFGQTDGTSGDWLPKSYAGTYGANGFYLNFADHSNTTAATLGKDTSPNANHWTPANFSVTGGGTNDSLTDSPTQSYPKWDGFDSAGTISEGGFRIAATAASRATMKIPETGSWYFEVDIVSKTYIQLGLAKKGVAINGATTTGNIGFYDNGSGTHLFYEGGVSSNYTSAGFFAAGDTACVFIDSDAGKIWIARSRSGVLTYLNSAQSPAPGAGLAPIWGAGSATPASGVSMKEGYYPAVGTGGSTETVDLNFGQRPFAQTPPTAFKALNTQNLPAITQAVTAPDLVWIKSRSAGTDHALYDTVRSAPFDLMSNATTAETSQPTGLTGFTKTGFTLGSLAKVNTAGATYTATVWKKGASPGFDIVADVGTGSAKTVSHSLGAKPALMIRKSRVSGSGHWYVYHTKTGAAQAGILQTSNAFAGSTAWNSTEPTASVFSVGSNIDENKSGDDYITYLWSEVPGFSRFGSYTGTSSADGPFIWCGFRPAWILIKCYDSAGLSWNLVDSTRAPNNLNSVTIPRFYLQTASAESADTGIDFLANGLKIREGGGGAFNDGGRNYIFIAFAEAPFKYARGR